MILLENNFKVKLLTKSKNYAIVVKYLDISGEYMIEDLENRFTFHQNSRFKNDVQHKNIREGCHLLARIIVQFTPESREQSLAITKLEEAMFWANAALARSSK